MPSIKLAVLHLDLRPPTVRSCRNAFIGIASIDRWNGSQAKAVATQAD